MIDIQIPGLLYFQNGGQYTGGAAGDKEVRYKITADDKFTVQIWHGPYCYEKSEIIETKEFALSNDERSAMIEWLTTKLSEMI